MKRIYSRTAILAVSFSSLLPMIEGCGGHYPPVGNPIPDSGSVSDGGRRDGGRISDGGGINLPDAGGRPTCAVDSERLYVGGGPAAFDGDLFVLESSTGYSAEISISDSSSGRSTFISIPQWGSQTFTLSGKTFTIFVNDLSDASPSWADVDIYGC